MSEERSEFEQLVLEHIEAEDAKDPERVRATYGEDPTFYDVPSGERLERWPDILEAYRERWIGFPNATRRVDRIQTGEDGTFVEITLAGLHEGPYQGLAPTGEYHELEICAFFEPDDEGLIDQETAYYDALSAAEQLGLLPDLDSSSGRLWLVLHRPSLLLRMLQGKWHEFRR